MAAFPDDDAAETTTAVLGDGEDRLEWDTLPALSGATTTASETMVLGVLLGMSVMCVACVGALCIASLARKLRLRALRDMEAKAVDVEATLPSYTLVSGLPTYDEALDQLQRRRELRRSSSAQRAIELAVAAARAAGNLITVKKLQAVRQLSVHSLLQYTFRSNSFDKG